MIEQKIVLTFHIICTMWTVSLNTRAHAQQGNHHHNHHYQPRKKSNVFWVHGFLCCDFSLHIHVFGYVSPVCDLLSFFHRVCGVRPTIQFNLSVFCVCTGIPTTRRLDHFHINAKWLSVFTWSAQKYALFAAPNTVNKSNMSPERFSLSAINDYYLSF